MRSIQVSVMATAFFLIPGLGFAAEEVPVSELVEMAAEMSEAEVTVVGELVGDYGFRDDGSMWTQLNGDPYVQQPIRDGGSPVGANTGIAVRIPIELAEGLDPPGGYRNRGPVVEVTGIWKYHDPDRRGETYLEVSSLVVSEGGRPLSEEVNWGAVIVGLLLVGTAAGVRFIRPGGQSQA